MAELELVEVNGFEDDLPLRAAEAELEELNGFEDAAPARFAELELVEVSGFFEFDTFADDLLENGLAEAAVALFCDALVAPELFETDELLLFLRGALDALERFELLELVEPVDIVVLLLCEPPAAVLLLL